MFSFSGQEYIFAMNLVLALAIGVLIGAEREVRGKPAGISTHSFVVGGAMIFAFISNIVDPNSRTRIAAQIIAGVGFLGAGIILKSESGKITNLTTAASIWFSASLGMALGFNLYVFAILGLAYALIVPRIPNLKDLQKKKEVLEKIPGPHDVTHSLQPKISHALHLKKNGTKEHNDHKKT
jgi:putative Mg2+ transporter-C (MgtC) family protein